ncbi:MAG: hypothetical protein ACHREM_01265 [Polyangiales bacterium]
MHDDAASRRRSSSEMTVLSEGEREAILRERALWVHYPAQIHEEVRQRWAAGNVMLVPNTFCGTIVESSLVTTNRAHVTCTGCLDRFEANEAARLKRERELEERRRRTSPTDRSRADAATRRATPLVYQGINLRDELEAMARLPVLRPHLRLRSLPKLVVRHGSRRSGSFHGRAYLAENRILITIEADARLADILEVLLHELVHHACPRRENHGPLFIKRLNLAAMQHWGINVVRPLSVPVGGYANRAYAVDSRLRAMLRERLDNGDFPRYSAGGR